MDAEVLELDVQPVGLFIEHTPVNVSCKVGVLSVFSEGIAVVFWIYRYKRVFIKYVHGGGILKDKPEFCFFGNSKVVHH